MENTSTPTCPVALLRAAAELFPPVYEYMSHDGQWKHVQVQNPVKTALLARAEEMEFFLSL